MSVTITTAFFCVTFIIYHDVDFCFPLLDDEGASKSQAFIRVAAFESLPQGRHKTVASCPLFGSHLYDLKRYMGTASQLV